MQNSASQWHAGQPGPHKSTDGRRHLDKRSSNAIDVVNADVGLEDCDLRWGQHLREIPQMHMGRAVLSKPWRAAWLQPACTGKGLQNACLELALTVMCASPRLVTVMFISPSANAAMAR